MATAGSVNRPRLFVGMGASAGGLDPLLSFFDHVPEATGFAFVIVQHLSPDFRSLMDELLARHTRLPIKLVLDGMPVEADHVYLIPPKKEMIISGGRLLLSERDPQQELTLPIDVFFRSLAQDCGPEAAAIVLSGGGSDGSRGISEVAARGGLVLVQDPECAQFDGMPRAAAGSGAAHHLLRPADMPRVLLERAADRRRQPREEDTASAADRQGLEAVYQMLQREFGIDFTRYKPSTVTRRIERRLALARSQDVEEYIARLRQERQELDALYHDLLIGVTRFFRDEGAFAVLEEKVLPELLAREPREQPLRLWVAGCATGEEAYSLAILVQDGLARLGPRPVKIFATDVHPGSLERAARAVYDDEAVAGVSPERLARYFTRAGRSWQVVPELKQLIVFARHDVIRDAPFTRVDLISCRNLLIYLQPAVQQRVLSVFHFSLNRNGTLLLGPSESLGGAAPGFEVLDKHWQLYRKQDARAVDPKARPDFALAEGRPARPLPGTPPRHSLTQLLGTYDALLEQFMPPGLLCNERGELVHVFGGAGRYLVRPDGRQTLDVLELVGGELKTVLSGSLRRALAEPEPVVFRGVRLAGGEVCRVTVRGVKDASGGVPSALVSFEPLEPAAASRPPAEVDLDQASREQLSALQAELSHTKESLQTAIEELEASNEELQASNEELQTSNEELQSTNEELQSVNEELYTVNAEYQRKIAELVELTNDMDNLLASTEIGTIFLDSQLRIRKFTPQIAALFDVVPHDIGRPIAAFAHRMDHPELVEDLRRVLDGEKPIERELRDKEGRAFFLRLLPYRVRGSVDGVVLTVIDVSGLKAAEDALFHERYLLNSLLETVPDAIYFKDADGRFIRVNHAMARRLDLSSPAEAAGRSAFDLPSRDAAAAMSQADAAVLSTGEPQLYTLERRRGAEEAEAWDLATRLPLRGREGTIVGLIGIFRDVTEQKRAEAKIQEAVRRRDQFLAMLSHELRNPLGAMVTATSILAADPARRPQDSAALAVLERQSRQMARLLDELLEASRVTQNKIELRRSRLDLCTVAQEAADALRGVMDARALQFVVKLEEEPVWVDGDPARLQQIQANLLSNAAKYTSPGGTVVLQVGREEGRAVVRVRDDGVGIAPPMLDSIFDLFVQSSRTLDRAAGGLGLGLTLVRSLVELHGGTVSAHSAGEGRGSEFVVRLPLAEAPAAQPPRRLAAPVLGPARVLVVEDNADSREMLCALLERSGFECQGAASGPEALALADTLQPAVVILDVGLPEMNGYEVVRALRASPRHAATCVVALTGYGQPADREASLAAGFDAHLVKPVDAEQLLAVIAKRRGRPGAEAPEPVAAGIMDGALASAPAPEPPPS